MRQRRSGKGCNCYINTTPSFVCEVLLHVLPKGMSCKVCYARFWLSRDTLFLRLMRLIRPLVV